MMNISQKLEFAVERQRAGHLAEAEALYQQILAEHPNHPDALHMLGIVAFQSGRADVAAEMIRRAIEVNPRQPQFHHNLGLALAAMGKFSEAAAAYEQCLILQPTAAEAHFNLGNALRAMGRHAEGISQYRYAISLRPDHLNSFFALGRALVDQGDLPGAIASFRRACDLNPPDFQPFDHLSNALAASGAVAEALAAFRPAVQRWPNDPAALNQFGLLLLINEELDDAIATFRRTLAIDENNFAAMNNLGHALQNKGNIDEAIACYEKAMKLRPDLSVTGSNRLMALLMKPDLDAHALLREHIQWDEQYARPFMPSTMPHTENRDSDRRLRIGYVSPDFRDHVVGWNLLALLSNHDRENFEIYCYASLSNPDAMSEKIYRQIHTWRNILGASDDQAAEIIRQDKIDILVDLSMHSANNRLLVFARKPAPVQVTYLGYAGTTGMEAMDYRLSDPCLDPPGTDLSVYSEKTIRLPHTYWCYQPGGATPDVNAAPSLANGYVTFGCLNNFAKVSAEALRLWGNLLTAMPSSHLILHCPSKAHWQPVLSQFAGMGVPSDRIELVGRQKFPGYIETYGRIDIALDPFPYGGAITTCDSLWMGVPVVTLSGGTAVGRAAQSILCNVGLPELVAKSTDEYIQIAANLASDPAHLESLRAGLRQRLADSPVMNTKQFARDIEAAYRTMWKDSK